MVQTKFMKDKRLGLLGGTFNPIHLGHLHAARIVKAEFDLNKVFFIPSYIPPHKDRKEMVSAEHRMEMVELAIQGFPDFYPSSVEIDAGGKSYSINTLRKFRKLYSDADIFFILGIDAFLEIETWMEHEKLLEESHFIVISRPGYSLFDATEILDNKYPDKVVNLSDFRRLKRTKKTGPLIILFPFKALDISSTQIRERIKTGKSISGFVPDRVENFITKNKLYQ